MSSINWQSRIDNMETLTVEGEGEFSGNVEIDGVLKVDDITEFTASHGVHCNVDFHVDIISEITTGNGVIVDGVQCKDSGIIFDTGTVGQGDTSLKGYETDSERSYATTGQGGVTTGTMLLTTTRIGNLVTVYYDYTHNTASSSFAQTTASVPTRFRPRSEIFFRQAASAAGNSNFIQLSYISDGGSGYVFRLTQIDFDSVVVGLGSLAEFKGSVSFNTDTGWS